MVRARRKIRRRKAAFTLPIAVVAGFVPGIARTMLGFQNGGWVEGTKTVGEVYLGYDWLTGTFVPGKMWMGTAPLLIGLVVHKVASLFGVNRALGRARIPFVRI